MGLFGRKKSPEEILAEGRAQFIQGDLKKAFLTLHKLAAQGNAQAGYYIGRIYLERKERSLAQRFLTAAAWGGVEEAGTLLAREFGVRDYLPRDAAPAPAPAPEPPKPAPEPKAEPPKPAPAPKAESKNEREPAAALADAVKGLEAYKAGDAATARQHFEQAARLGSVSSCYNLGLLWFKGQGGPKDAEQALAWFRKAEQGGHEKAAQAIRQVQQDQAAEASAARMRASIEESKRREEAITAAPGGDEYRRGEELRRAKDYDGAVAAWEQAAAQGHPEAFKRLAGFYAGELGVWGLRSKEVRERYLDYDKAIEWGRRGIAQGADLAGAVVKAYEAKGDFEAGLRFGREAAGQGLHPEWEMMYLCLKAERWQEAADWAARYDARKGGDEARRRLAQTAGADYSKGRELWQKEQYAEALPWLRKAAAQGSADAMFYLGVACDHGRGTPVDKAAAFGWFKKAAEQGDPDAQFNCGMMCFKGEGTAQDKTAAFGWYQKAAEQGHAIAQFNCGNMCYKGEGTAEDMAAAFGWYQKAAEQGDPDAQFRCGFMLRTGEGIGEDKAAAFAWYRKAAEQGHASSQLRCGVMCETGEGVPQDKATAFDWFHKAAEQGIASAQFRCGFMLRTGEGVDQDQTAAFGWYKKAAEQGDVAAQFRCGWACDNGEGVPQDKAAAFGWYKKAAEQGDAAAQFNCGNMCYKGEGTVQNMAVAFGWYKKAAEQGDADAQVRCGAMCFNGEGTPRDRAQAKTWLQQAAQDTGSAGERARKILREHF